MSMKSLFTLPCLRSRTIARNHIGLRSRRMVYTGFKSVNVDLPFGDRMFEGPGADVANNNCLACHSVGMHDDATAAFHVETWEAEVAKMRNVYKAPIANEDVTPIVDYLSKLQK